MNVKVNVYYACIYFTKSILVLFYKLWAIARQYIIMFSWVSISLTIFFNRSLITLYFFFGGGWGIRASTCSRRSSLLACSFTSFADNRWIVGWVIATRRYRRNDAILRWSCLFAEDLAQRDRLHSAERWRIKDGVDELWHSGVTH